MMAIPPYAAGAFIVNGTVELKSLLGVGGYAFVYHALDYTVVPPREFAVKCLLHSPDKLRTQLLRREIKLHSMVCDGPDIVPVRRIVREGDRTFIFMDLCHGGDLYTAIIQNKCFDRNDALIRRVFLQVVDAVAFIHKRHIYHRDLKPENILFTDPSCSKALLTDFGLATSESFTAEFRFGSSGYIAPEAYTRYYNREQKYSAKHNDIWALAVLLINMITGRTPWGKACISDRSFAEYRKSPHYYFLKLFPVTPEVNRLLLRMLALDWRDRISLADVRSAVSRISHFTHSWEDSVINQHILSFPASFPSEASIRRARQSVKDAQPSQLLAGDTVVGSPPCSALPTAPQEVPDCFLPASWTPYASPTVSTAPNSSPSPTAVERWQPPSPQFASETHDVEPTRCVRHKPNFAARKEVRRRPYHVDSFGLPALGDSGDDGVIEVDDATNDSEPDIRLRWHSDSDNTSTDVSTSGQPDVAVVVVPTAFPSQPSAVMSMSKRSFRSWFQKPFWAFQRRRNASRTHALPISVVQES